MGNTGYPRNHGLDFLKGIAACFIVFVHVVFPWPYGVFVAYLGSFAVSVFFMTSGYYSYGASKGKLLHSVKRTVIYLLVAYVLYLFKMLALEGFHVRPVVDFLLNEVFTVEHLL
jgi:peptidoglycan/LPS O-acetylase OafA/YrhL